MLKEIKKAFTLAEVLIVIGIIGVVAALTLPNLNHATGDKEKVTKVKKIYSTLTEAVDRAQAIYGPCDKWIESGTDWAKSNEIFAKRITEFMKVSKDCGLGDGCFSDSVCTDYDENFESSSTGYLSYLKNNYDAYMLTLADGISIAFITKDMDIGNDIIEIKVDIDGPNKGKNQYGNDLFDFNLVLREWASSSWANNMYNRVNQLTTSSVYYDAVFTPSSHSYVTSWVIENGNLDYLKCPDELNWETKTSCE